MRLDDSDTAWVQAVVARAALIHVRDHQLAYDTLWVIVLVAHDAENARIYRQSVEVLILQSLLPLHKLRTKGKVRIGAGTAFLNTSVPLLIRDPFSKDQVCDANGGRTGNSLYAMNVDLAALISAILNELDGIVENAGDVFLVMIF